jgi:hypothetical protein
LGNARSSTSVINYEGGVWYAWGRSAVIPNSCWQPGWGYYAAEVAATNPGGDLFTFDTGFWNYRSQYSSILDLYDARGAGTRAVVFTGK